MKYKRIKMPNDRGECFNFSTYFLRFVPSLDGIMTSQQFNRCSRWLINPASLIVDKRHFGDISLILKMKNISNSNLVSWTCPSTIRMLFLLSVFLYLFILYLYYIYEEEEERGRGYIAGRKRRRRRRCAVMSTEKNEEEDEEEAWSYLSKTKTKKKRRGYIPAAAPTGASQRSLRWGRDVCRFSFLVMGEQFVLQKTKARAALKPFYAESLLECPVLLLLSCSSCFCGYFWCQTRLEQLNVV